MAPPLTPAPKKRDKMVGTFIAVGAGSRYQKPIRRWRFLLSDGSTFDVITEHRDDSELRSDVLHHTGVESIEGVVELPLDHEP